MLSDGTGFQIAPWANFCIFIRFGFGEIAQLVEQRTENPCVPGSIPGLATTFKLSVIVIYILSNNDQPSFLTSYIAPIRLLLGSLFSPVLMSDSRMGFSG